MPGADLLADIKFNGRIPDHVAIIMDGNGRWARSRGLPRHRGHSAGMKSVREAVEGAIEAGVAYLTLFAFSQENWNRPAAEISALMTLLRRYMIREQQELRKEGVRVCVLGERDRLPPAARKATETIERLTAGGNRLRLNLMISYGGRAELIRAARLLAEQAARGVLSPADIDEEHFSAALWTAGVPDPDLLIRTSGEQRVSNFLLWQIAYTELYVSPVLWPDFRRHHLFAAIHDFQKRDRRFGRVSAV